MTKKPTYHDLVKRIEWLEKAAAEAGNFQEALRESEEKFRALADSTPIAMMLYQDNRYIYANKAAETISGYSAEELLGMDAWLIVHPDYQALIRERVRKRQEGEDKARRYELKIVMKNGTEKWVDLAGASTMIGGRPAGLISVIDLTERRRAEKALKESEANYRQLFDNAPAAIYRVDFKNGKFVRANDVFCEYSGYSREELAELSPFDILTEDSKKLFLERLEKMARGIEVPVAVEYEIIGKTGRQWCVLLRNSNIYDDQGHVVASDVIAHDITERKQAEKALQESEERYRSDFVHSKDAILLSKLDGSILDANPAASEMFGRSLEEIQRLGRNGLTDMTDPRLQAAINELMNKSAMMAEITMLRANGERFPAEVTSVIFVNAGGRQRNCTIIRDLSEKRQVEQAYQTLFREMLDGFALHEIICSDQGKPVNYRYLAVNPAFERITGVKAEQIIGRTVGEVLPGTVDYLIETCGRVALTGEPAFFENYEKTLDKYFEITAYQPAFKQFACIFADITDRKRAEAEKRNLEERLNRAEKMEALGQLAGGVAHDLNNVLGILTGYSELLLMEIPEGQRAKGHVEKILQSTEKGAAIIQDLLTLARRGVTVADVVNLNDIVSAFLKTPVFEKIKNYHPRVTFRTERDETLLNIKGSSVHLEKTLMNLVSNAAESISGEGEVIISVQSRYLDKAVRGYDEVKEGDYTVLTVSDTGMGIPVENREKIFEPFYTKKTMGRSGTGLGLAIVWGTVKDHNGYIDVKSNVGEGTTFTLYFPATREELITPQQKEPIEHYMGNGESVLVVDDIAEQRDIASRLLTQLGYKVQAVSSGEEAVEYLKQRKTDILVLDMIMAPGIDGLETYVRVLEINPKQKAILVSGFSETDRVREAQRRGAGAYVKKPYLTEKIGTAIRDELKR